MNYALHYNRLIERAESRALVGVYTERHHVVPRCVDKASKYTVRLTPEEHYVAHQLLVKMSPRNPGLVRAAFRMTGDCKAHPDMQRNNKSYGWLRRAYSESLKGNTYAAGARWPDERRAASSRRMSARNASADNPWKKLRGVPWTGERRAAQTLEVTERLSV